ncbi:acyltransferase [Commensalibacter communis]|uniref:acyltransferase n=1 Tax=Commensalibacter communis TaxID=2972786 RepID=UPI0022FF7A17|nr:acyltransferase family protein [Commensalibacter communis]CAI3934488.1 Surface polysaccharide O-acyltransferase WecH (WecH) (PUBMED:16936038) [Commensalibacter communis]CAI3943743.1 Surface polysaccharide O-acyltransferase WecH (WecH) (PUBMED:16936038) [Commensalibacter communis]
MRKNINIEVLRCLAIIAVILIHNSAPYFVDNNLIHKDILGWGVIYFYYTMSRFCVPVFFIISAYLYFTSNKPFQYMKRARRLLLPFFAWSVIYWYFLNPHIWDTFWGILSSPRVYHLWFLYIFIGYSFLLPLLLSFAKNADKNEYKPTIILIFIFAIILPSLYQFLLLFGIKIAPISGFYFDLPAYLVFALAMPFILKKIKMIYSIVLYSVLIIINMILAMISTYQKGSFSDYWFTDTTFFVFTSSLVLFNLFIHTDLSFIKGKLAWLVYKIGECSFGIYLCHVLVTEALFRMNICYFGSAIVGPIINTLIVFITSFIFCLGCSYFKYIRVVLL